MCEDGLSRSRLALHQQRPLQGNGGIYHLFQAVIGDVGRTPGKPIKLQHITSQTVRIAVVVLRVPRTRGTVREVPAPGPFRRTKMYQDHELPHAQCDCWLQPPGNGGRTPTRDALAEKHKQWKTTLQY